MKKFIIAAALLWAAMPLRAEGTDGGRWHLTARAAYCPGATSPLQMPESIREINSFSMSSNPLAGIGVGYSFTPRWGVEAALHFEGKGMHTDAQVVGYKMSIVQGGSSLDGVFTGGVTTDVQMWMFTLPLRATFAPTPKLTLGLGPYVSLLTSGSFGGNAHDGYLRVGGPTGARVDLGGTEATRGDYQFNDDLRSLQAGVSFQFDWRFWRGLSLGVGLEWGLTGIFKNSFDVVEQTLYPIFGSLGLGWRF